MYASVAWSGLRDQHFYTASMSQQPDPVKGCLRVNVADVVSLEVAMRMPVAASTTAAPIKTFRLGKNRVSERRSLPPSRSAVAGSISLLTRRV
jgi:hypothetical protein